MKHLYLRYRIKNKECNHKWSKEDDYFVCGNCREKI